MNLSSATVEIEDVVTGWHQMSGATRDGLVVAGVLLGMTLLLAFWAAFVRKKKRRHSHRKHEILPDRRPEADGPKRRKWRRRRREHRPRNPTLAETGGLPPARTERPPEGPAI